MLKHFQMWLRFRGDIHIERSNFLLRGAIDTEKKTVEILQRTFLIPRCQWHGWDKFRSVNDTVETNSAVSMTRLRLTPQCQWNHHHEFDFAVSKWHRGVFCTCKYIYPRNRKYSMYRARPRGPNGIKSWHCSSCSYYSNIWTSVCHNGDLSICA